MMRTSPISSAPIYPTPRALIATEPLLCLALGLLCIIRLMAIILTPLEFGVDEAQYWLWGQHLDFGYYSKPPLIGWYLGLLDTLFGSSAITARITAPLIHTLIALILYAIAAAHHSRSAGRWAALLWASLPIVSLGSFVISTDTLLLLPWLIALALFFAADNRPHKRLFFYTGLVIGIGLLAKYAAIYFILGAAIILLTNKAKARKTQLTSLGLIILGALITASPNLLWNLANGGVTFAHLGENADLAKPLYSFASAFEFTLSQSAVIGPICFILFCAAILRIPRLSAPVHRQFSTRLLAFSLPVLAFMITQAYLKTANANWAATAWPTACLLIGIFLSESPAKSSAKPSGITHRRFWGRLALSVNIFVALMIAIALGAGSFGQWTPASDPLRRLRGWDALATDVQALAKEHDITIIIADRRAEAALLSWHLHDTDIAVKVYDGDGYPGSHFELKHALATDDKGPFLIMTGHGDTPPPAFTNPQGPIASSLVTISANRTRHKDFFIINSF